MNVSHTRSDHIRRLEQRVAELCDLLASLKDTKSHYINHSIQLRPDAEFDVGPIRELTNREMNDQAVIADPRSHASDPASHVITVLDSSGNEGKDIYLFWSLAGCVSLQSCHILSPTP